MDKSSNKKKFDPSLDDIERICRFFSIGKLQHYEKEKGITLPHPNFFVFVETTQGQYAFKFYRTDAAKRIAIEYAINRILVNHHFPTPIMYAGHGGQPFFPSNNRFAACYSYIDGLPAWKYIEQQNIIHQVNAAMLSLKNILSTTKGRIPFQKHKSLATTINILTQNSRTLAPYDQNRMIDKTLLEALRTYQNHRLLFTRRWLHNDANLTNFLVYKKTVYTLDLDQVKEDYALSDLASIIISCLFFHIPAKTIKIIIKDYFTQHGMGTKHALVLTALVKIELVKEYLKNIQRKKSVNLSVFPSEHGFIHFAFSSRKESIGALLTKMDDISKIKLT